MPRPRLKIAFVVDRFGHRFGGAEAYGVELMRELAIDHDITVFARDYDPACDVQLPFVPVRAWSILPSWLRVLLFACRVRRLTRKGYDVVHSHTNGWSGDIEVVHVTPVRYNWRVRPLSLLKRLSSYISPRVHTYLWLEKRRVRQRPAHRTVAVSGLIADQLRQAYGNNRDFPIIPPGVTRPVPPAEGEALRMRVSLGLAPDDYVCLLVARNPLRKGLPTVVKALARLPAHYKLLVVGSNAATRNFVHGSPDYASLSDRIRLIDETSDVAPYYLTADLYVHPTLNDSFGMAPLEAMSFGLPVILSPAPWCGFAQYVEDGQDVMMLDHPENNRQLAQFIQRMSEDVQWRRRLVQGGSQVVDRHAWSAVAESYLELYGQVLEERRQG
ncbi:glycosyltransferase family 4 protein [Pollutimonas harenae]|uniref:Glycosyltransferase family 4 protein n=1 Tax=Pollutimonas harenae TaxID=657015 RepID=A0A853GTZ2_9BURK|nr:glycosyltransferase family 4 protein [Pollutimonas harenae]NYT86638.1 glycosyltransferase family 4 protein [Pollutimonas harenae]TEA69624.1 glycosyltransferase family 1 protein [Pollutimonas harenae]